VITNESSLPVTLSVTGYAWISSLHEPQLKSTDEVIAFPAIFTLLPLQQQTLRVGVTAPVGAVERAYRVLVNELPTPAVRINTKGLTIRVLSGFSVPVFLAPDTATMAPDLQNARITGGSFSVDLSNRGSAHLPPTSISIEVRDAAGHALWDHQGTAWYVLPGETRPISVKLPPTVCAAARVVAVRAIAEGIDLRRQYSGIPISCRS